MSYNKKQNWYFILYKKHQIYQILDLIVSQFQLIIQEISKYTLIYFHIIYSSYIICILKNNINK